MDLDIEGAQVKILGFFRILRRTSGVSFPKNLWIGWKIGMKKSVKISGEFQNGEGRRRQPAVAVDLQPETTLSLGNGGFHKCGYPKMDGL